MSNKFTFSKTLGTPPVCYSLIVVNHPDDCANEALPIYIMTPAGELGWLCWQPVYPVPKNG